MNQEIKDMIKNESQYPAQNLEGIYCGIDAAIAEDRPFRLACFACLPGEWVQIGNKLLYRVNDDSLKLTRLEQPEILERTWDLVAKLDATCIPFQWDFPIADTELTEVFNDYLKPDEDAKAAVSVFQSRFNKTVTEIMPESLSAPIWSDILASYRPQYDQDWQRVAQLKDVRDEVEARFPDRLAFYRRVFIKQGMKVNDSMLMPICKFVPFRNRCLYGAETPIIRKQYDVLVIADRDPKRLAGYHSVLVPDQPIWMPYPGG